MKNAELGQVWTPEKIAIKMAKIVLRQVGKRRDLKILDPATGPATFTNALYEVGILDNKKNSIVNYDIDSRWIKYTKKFSTMNGINSENIEKNYLLSNHKYSGNFDVVIMNPPYIRHEKIEKHLKDIYLERFDKEFNTKIDGRSNLFAFFILKAIKDLKIGGVLCAIVYDGIENTKYGRQLLEILEENSELIELENTKMPFDKVLVDASIIVAKKIIKKRPDKYKSINYKKDISPKYTLLNDLMRVRRGTELINNRVFLAEQDDPYFEHAKDFFKKQSKLKHLIIPACWTEKAYVFGDNEDIPKGFQEWIEQKSNMLISKKLISSHKTLEKNLKGKRNSWFKHNTITGDIVFNYYFRDNPRFLLNPGKITISNNYYAIDPIGIEKEIAWLLLNTDLYKNAVIKNSRSQGNGLSKIQVYEYKNSIIPDWRLLDEDIKKVLLEIAINFIHSQESKFLVKANLIVENYFSQNYV